MIIDFMGRDFIEVRTTILNIYKVYNKNYMWKFMYKNEILSNNYKAYTLSPHQLLKNVDLPRWAVMSREINTF